MNNLEQSTPTPVCCANHPAGASHGSRPSFGSPECGGSGKTRGRQSWLSSSPPNGGRAGPAKPGRSGGKLRLKLTALALATLGLGLVGNACYIHAKALLAQVLLDRAFTQSLATGQPVKAWNWADTWPVARITVPRINASAVVLHGGSMEALAFGPGHLEQSAQPGETGTAVFSAHRDTHFTFLRDVKTGDRIEVTRTDGKSFAYEVTGNEVVRWDQSRLTNDNPDKRLALTTCWPLDGKFQNDMRYVVHAKLIESQVSQTPVAPRTPRTPS